MESTATTTNENATPSIASAKSKVAATTDTAKYDANGQLASLSSTYTADSERAGADIAEDPPTAAVFSAQRDDVRDDAWDAVNELRKTLKANSRGYLATTAAFVIGTCFLVSVVAGTLLALPVVVLVSAYDHVYKFFSRREERKEDASKLRIVPGSESK